MLARLAPKVAPINRPVAPLHDDWTVDGLAALRRPADNRPMPASARRTQFACPVGVYVTTSEPVTA